jgi:hypothetical protein
VDEGTHPSMKNPARAYSRLAIASFAQGLAASLACFICVYAGVALQMRLWVPAIASLPLGLSALVCGIWALRRLGRRPELRGEGLAIAGIVLGAIPLVTFL